MNETNQLSQITSRQMKLWRKKWFVTAGCLLLLIGVISAIKIITLDHSPIPATIRASVPFTIYYPDQKKLPTNYSFNVASISSTNQAVVYRIDKDGQQAFAVTEQAKPSDKAINEFYAKNIPLRTSLSSHYGQAVLSILNNQTIISLVTNRNTWILITAPNNFQPDQANIFLAAFVTTK